MKIMHWRAGTQFTLDFIAHTNDRMLSIMHLGTRWVWGIKRKGKTLIIHLGIITVHYKTRKR